MNASPDSPPEGQPQPNPADAAPSTHATPAPMPEPPPAYPRRGGLFMALGAFLLAVFGSWTPPVWAQRGASLARRNPLRALVLGVMVGLAVWGVIALLCHRPPPPKVPWVKVKASTPAAPTLIEGKPVAHSWMLKFDQPVARVDDMNKDLPGDFLGIVPAVKGKWRWTSDNRLDFTPDAGQLWKPGEKYHAVIRKSMLAPKISFPPDITVTFEAPRLTATASGQEIYIDPTDTDVRRVAVTYKFNYPVTLDELMKRTELKTQGKENLFPDAAPGEPLFSFKVKPHGMEATLLSAPLTLPKETAFAVVRLKEGTESALGSGRGDRGALEKPLETSVAIPDVTRLMRIGAVKPEIITGADGTPQQVLIVETTVSTRADDVARYLQVRLLPKDRPKLPAVKGKDAQPPAPGMGASATNGHGADAESETAAAEDFDWSSDAEAIDARVVDAAPQLTATPIPSDKERDTVHVFRLSDVPEGRYLWVKIGGGMPGPGRVVLKDDFKGAAAMPAWPRHLSLMHPGSLLALGGERKIGVMARAVKKLKYRIGRLTPAQIHHLLSQTSGDMADLSFETYRFGEDSLTEVFEREEDLTQPDPSKPAYGSIDFTEYLRAPSPLPASRMGTPGTGDPRLQTRRGIFFLRVAEVRERAKRAEGGGAGEGEGESSEESTGDGEDSERSDMDDAWGEDNRLSPVEMERDDETAFRERNRKWSSRDRREEQKAEPNLLSDRRFIIVTDLGMIVKHNADMSRDIFVQSIQSGKPVAGVTVEVIGVNGVPVATATTNADGRASLPVIAGLKHERLPIAIVARLEDDISFIPFRSADRRVNDSRFDVGGVRISSPSQLTAFAFTDRGIYRPGDTMKLAFSVKQQDWQGKLDGTPLELVIMDPRGNSLVEERFNVPGDGFFDRSVAVPETSPTGTYNIGLYTIAKKGRGYFIGGCTARVEEFLPDRMKIRAKLSVPPTAGWVQPTSAASPNGLKIDVELEHLTGGPAEGNTVTGQLTLHPAEFVFPQYEDYLFFDPLRDDTAPRRPVQEDMAETTTDTQGKAVLDPHLEKFERSAFRMTYVARGQEKGSGRGVSDGGSILVSSLDWVVGYKPEASLDYVKQGTACKVNLIAVGPDLKPVAPGELTMVVKEQYYVSVLTLGDNGKHAYQSVQKEREVASTTVTLGTATSATGPAGTDWLVPTATPGNFVAELKDKDGHNVAVIRFTVAGKANLERSMERNAELKAAIPKVEFAPGEEIEISITAPYTGSGLITIERDKVYATQWFRAETNSSVQKIRVPAGLEGNAYVNISFVRALDSRELYTSPLSTAIVPFRINRDARTTHVKLDVPEKARPGEDLTIRYSASRPTRLVVYAVDEGILQVAKYQLPKPLDWFYRKRALQMVTEQILDLILPEYTISRDVAAAGGGEGAGLLAANLNPFKRKDEPPVVFWSGIIEAGTDVREMKYRIPGYFNGKLRVMAVAVSPDAAGCAEAKVTARSPVVIQPSAPMFAAPGDVFEVPVTLMNYVEGSGPDAKISFRAEAKPGAGGKPALEIAKAPDAEVAIPEGRERTVVFTCRALDALGNATLAITAGGRSAAPGAEPVLRTRETSLSIRPAAPFRTEITSGTARGPKPLDIALNRRLYPEFARAEADASSLPLALTRGLTEWLKDYPHQCSEQITSRGMALVVLAGYSRKSLITAPGAPSPTQAAETVRAIAATLRSRQSSNGKIGLWRAEPISENSTVSWDDYPTIYAALFLTEAADRQTAIPAQLQKDALEYLRKALETTPNTVGQARLQAMAVYVLTRNGVVTTSYLEQLRTRLDALTPPPSPPAPSAPAAWRTDIAGIYMAASYAMLRDGKSAKQYVDEYERAVAKAEADARAGGKKRKRGGEDRAGGYTRQADDRLQRIFLICRHLPEEIGRIRDEEVEALAATAGKEITTQTAAWAVLAFEAMANPTQLGNAGGKGNGSATDRTRMLRVVSIQEVIAGGSPREPATKTDGAVATATFSPQATAARILPGRVADGVTTYYQVLTAGFDRPATASASATGKPLPEIANGIEISRAFLAEDGKPAGPIANRAPGAQAPNVEVGKELYVRITARVQPGAGAAWLDNVAILDLLPAGFEVVPETIRGPDGDGYVETQVPAAMFHPAPAPGATNAPAPVPAGPKPTPLKPAYVDIREDRIVLYASLDTTLRTFVYKIRATNAGTYAVPPLSAEAMYDRAINARHGGGESVIVGAPGAR
ncbi:hypothetical protein DB346_00335 [Verrucomicrobia bacterium LW23]|nr:hypothetical protein DB346_00335 [Verrucomicrobia bacterium LW23]